MIYVALESTNESRRIITALEPVYGAYKLDALPPYSPYGANTCITAPRVPALLLWSLCMGPIN